nr:hypothetical protein Iba_chr05fCG6800 [Ipomoea batatas]
MGRQASWIDCHPLCDVVSMELLSTQPEEYQQMHFISMEIDSKRYGSLQGYQSLKCDLVITLSYNSLKGEVELSSGVLDEKSKFATKEWTDKKREGWKGVAWYEEMSHPQSQQTSWR